MRFIILLFGFFLVAGSAYAEEVTEAQPDAIYLELKPQFVVNLLGAKHYLRASVQLQLADEATKDAIEYNEAAIRHTLIVLLSNNNFNDINNNEGLADLRLRGIEALNETLKKQAGHGKVVELFFSEFISQ